jgi:hypothetical protein
MSDFVHECEQEWRRLGVPTAAANEMAADLRADLAEAAAEGVDAEHVLGNGIFDPQSFAADWANARGLVGQPRPERRFSRLLLPIGIAAASILAILIGLALVVRPHVSLAAVRRFPAPLRARPLLPTPLHVVSPGPINQPLGLALFALGLAGLVVALVLTKPWRLVRARHT